MAKNTFRRVIRKTGRALKRRYFKGKGYTKPKLSRMARDLAIVKQMVNAEKEIYTAASITSQGVSPTLTYFEPISNIPEGTAHGNRNGESVKLHGFRLNTRWTQQSASVGPQFFKLWLVKYIGPRGTTPNINTFLKPDFDGNFSVHSERNEDWYKSYQVICTQRGKIAPDNISNQTIYTMKKSYGRFKGHCHQRYSGAAGSTLLTDQMYLIAVAANGGVSINTACTFDAQLLISFYDN